MTGMPVPLQVRRAACPLAPTLKRAVSSLAAQYRDVARPVRRCPCGSNKEFTACHGAPTGAALHAKARCPCKGPKV